MNWYKRAITEKDFYEFYGYTGLTEEDLKENPVLLYNVIEHLNRIRGYYLQHLMQEIKDELAHAYEHFAIQRIDDELMEEIKNVVRNLQFNNLNEAISYFVDYAWDENIGGPAWAEIVKWTQELWSIGEIPQEKYSPQLAKDIFEMSTAIDVIHSLQHNTAMALIDLPEGEKEWLNWALEVAKYTRDPYQISQLSGDKTLMDQLRKKDKQKPLGVDDIYQASFQAYFEDNFLKEKYFPLDKIYNIMEKFRGINAKTAIMLGHALKSTIEKAKSYPMDIFNRLVALLNDILPYVTWGKWFRENTYAFKLYFDLYQSVYLEEALITEFVKASKSSNEYNAPDGFVVSQEIYDFLVSEGYLGSIQGVFDIDEKKN